MPSLWYCCDCSFGPHNADVHVSCINCSRRRCSGCKEEKASDSLHVHSHSHCHETSPYPAAINMNTHMHSLESKPMLPSVNLSRIRSLRPDFAASSFFSHGGTYMYYCCQCNDGPKVFNHQPQCINCNHVACSSCISVK